MAEADAAGRDRSQDQSSPLHIQNHLQHISDSELAPRQASMGLLNAGAEQPETEIRGRWYLERKDSALNVETPERSTAALEEAGSLQKRHTVSMMA